MLLAAGFGKRMRPLTDYTPKPLIPVLGKPLIEYALERLAAAGVTRVVVNLAHLGEQIRDHLGSGERWGVQIQYSAEDEPLETAGGIIHALPLLAPSPFLVINGDIWCDFPLATLRGVKCDYAHLVMVRNPAHNPRGDFCLRSGRIRQDGEPKFTYSGLAVYHPRFFDGCSGGKWSVVPLLQQTMESRLVTGQLHNGAWFDSGTPERLAALREAAGAN